jgi:hypothetical protein
VHYFNHLKAGIDELDGCNEREKKKEKKSRTSREFIHSFIFFHLLSEGVRWQQ